MTAMLLGVGPANAIITEVPYDFLIEVVPLITNAGVRTEQPNQTINVTGATVGATVELFDNGSLVGTATKTAVARSVTISPSAPTASSSPTIRRVSTVAPSCSRMSRC